MQAVEHLIEQYASQLERSIAAALDPRKLSPGGPAGASLLGGPDVARSTTGLAPGTPAKWQVGVEQAQQVHLGAWRNQAGMGIRQNSISLTSCWGANTV